MEFYRWALALRSLCDSDQNESWQLESYYRQQRLICLSWIHHTHTNTQNHCCHCLTWCIRFCLLKMDFDRRNMQNVDWIRLNKADSESSCRLQVNWYFVQTNPIVYTSFFCTFLEWHSGSFNGIASVKILLMWCWWFTDGEQFVERFVASCGAHMLPEQHKLTLT